MKYDNEKVEFQDSLQIIKNLDLDNLKWERYITPQDILYLVNRCPFLQIVSLSEVESFTKPKFIIAKSGWVIHHYGEAMSSSPGPLLFGDVSNRNDNGVGKGTLVRQAFDTATDMILLAQRSGWSGVRVVDGHAMMIWAAWMQASDNDFLLEGYEPDKKAYEKRKRVKRSEIQDQLQGNVQPHA